MEEKRSKKTIIVIAIIVILFIAGIVFLLPESKEKQKEKYKGDDKPERVVTNKTVHIEGWNVTWKNEDENGNRVQNTVVAPTEEELAKKYNVGTKIEDLEITFKKKGDNVKIIFYIYNDSDKDVENTLTEYGCSSDEEYNCDSAIAMDASCYNNDTRDIPVSTDYVLKKGESVYCELSARFTEEIKNSNGVKVQFNAGWGWE